MDEEETTLDGEEEEDWAGTWDGDTQCPGGQENQQSVHSFLQRDQTYTADLESKNASPKDTNKSSSSVVQSNSSKKEVLSRMLLNDHKAGMEGLDKEKINKIIMEASKGSRFYENERKKEEQVNKRVEEQQRKLNDITPTQLKEGLTQADSLLEDFDSMRDLSRTIVHIDMDAFYAAVEMRDDPSLKDKPMAVGGLSMLSTSNYHARKYGVRAAMPGFIGKKLCPDLVIVPLNFDKYTAVSKQVREILSDYDANFCPMSLDEAYLDITDHMIKRQETSAVERTYLLRKPTSGPDLCFCDLNETIKEEVLNLDVEGQREEDDLEHKSDCVGEGDCNGVHKSETDDSQDVKVRVCPLCGKPVADFDIETFGLSVEDAVNEMRRRIEQRTRLTASAGIAPNMMLAKVCSDKNKPNGQYRIQNTREAVMEFIKNLPIRKISGIGKVTEKMLNALGIQTTTDLYHQRALLYHLYSQISFQYFMRICLGIGSTTVERESTRKSMSTERTFREISQPTELYTKCRELCEALAEDLKEEELKGKTVGLKVKTVKFEVKTKAHTLPEYTWDLEAIYSAARDLLKTEIQNVTPQPLRLRLMGVRMSGLLHQSLCKKQQNTLTSLLKKMGQNKQSSSPSKTETEHLLNQERQLCEHVQHDIASDTDQGGECFHVSNPDSVTKDGSVDSRTECVNGEGQNKNEQNRDVTTAGSKDIYEVMRTADSKDIHEVMGEGNSVEDIRCEENSLPNLPNDYEDDDGVCSTYTESNRLGRDPQIDNTDVDVGRSEMRNFIVERDGCTVTAGPTRALPTDYTCPVCGGTMSCGTLTEFNSHIDVCLNKNIVKECSRYEPPEDGKRTNSAAKRTKGKSKVIPATTRGKLKIPDRKSSCIMKSPQESKSSLTEQCSTENAEQREDKKVSDQRDSDVMVCPVCFMAQSLGDLESFNQHVDSCLNKDTISKILTEQKTSERQSVKRPVNSPSAQSSKRKRQNSDNGKSASIVSFFKSTR